MVTPFSLVAQTSWTTPRASSCTARPSLLSPGEQRWTRSASATKHAPHAAVGLALLPWRRRSRAARARRLQRQPAHDVGGGKITPTPVLSTLAIPTIVSLPRAVASSLLFGIGRHKGVVLISLASALANLGLSVWWAMHPRSWCRSRATAPMLKLLGVAMGAADAAVPAERPRDRVVRVPRAFEMPFGLPRVVGPAPARARRRHVPAGRARGAVRVAPDRLAADLSAPGAAGWLVFAGAAWLWGIADWPRWSRVIVFLREYLARLRETRS